MVINQAKVLKAIEVISKIEKPSDGLPNAVKGDISSFGASIVQSGVLPSVLFYSESELKAGGNAWNDTNDRRANIMKIIFDVLERGTSVSKRPLFDYVKNNLKSENLLDDITESALAVKIALRAFKFDESKKSDN